MEAENTGVITARIAQCWIQVQFGEARKIQDLFHFHRSQQSVLLVAERAGPNRGHWHTDHGAAFPVPPAARVTSPLSSSPSRSWQGCHGRTQPGAMGRLLHGKRASPALCEAASSPAVPGNGGGKSWEEGGKWGPSLFQAVNCN